MRVTTKVFCAVAAIMLAPSIAACGTDLTIPSESGSGASGQSGAVGALDRTIGSGATRRIEIDLYPGEMVAREVEVEAEDQEEKLESAVTAIDPAAGTITLELGGLVVSYGSGTRFRTERESHESRSAWEAAVQARLSAGGRAFVEARRAATGAAQAPDDPSFAANDLRLEDELDAPKIEIYVDEENLSVSDSSLARLRVLGLSIEVNGRTQLRDDRGDVGNDDDGGTPSRASVEFEMGVAAVNAGAGTLTLTSGTVVRVTEATSISPEGDLFTLESVDDAVLAGRPVRAEGRGTVASSGPPAVIAATSLKVEVDD